MRSTPISSTRTVRATTSTVIFRNDTVKPPAAISRANGKPSSRQEEAESATRYREPQKLSQYDLTRIKLHGCKAWSIDIPPGFVGRTCNGGLQVATWINSQSFCVLSSLPLLAGLYTTRRQQGVYYEVTVLQMNGIIAIGTACKSNPKTPVPLPGWDRLSAGLHLTNGRKYFEDPDGRGEAYASSLRVKAGDVVGCGYCFSTGALFFTYNGVRLPDAFTGVYLPHCAHDVYAAIGMRGENEFYANFGREFFKWKGGKRAGMEVEQPCGPFQVM